MTRKKSALARSIFLCSVLCLIFVSLGAGYGTEGPQVREQQRAKVLGFILRQDLSNLHYSHKQMDDNLSQNAYTLYLKQLDGQKRFLLKDDVKKLSSYSTSIDNEMNSGSFELPRIAADILAKRATVLRQTVSQILSGDIGFSVREYVETDPEKLDFCATENELRERWRKLLKLQVLHQYLGLLEDNAGVAAAEKKADKPDHAKLLRTARERVLRTYETLFLRLQQTNERENLDRFFNSVTRAFDPHTEYMPPSSKEDFDISMRGTLEGIGATLREEDGYIKVVEIVPGSPAFRQGELNAEDTILKVAEGPKEPVDITYMSVKDAVKLIRGKKGTEVRLTIKKPNGRQAVVPIVRDVIQLEEGFVKGALLNSGKDKVVYGYIKIPSFYRDFDKTKNGGPGRNSTDDLRKELNRLGPDKISGLIIDLRNNGGGALTDAVKTAGLFIKTGPVVQVKASDGKVSILADDDPGISYSGPIIVLVNKFSASASEILAGALQDYGRALVIGGEHTHGKGTVQSILDLNSFYQSHSMDDTQPLGALRITTQKFYRITGESTQYRGITPDIVLPDQFQGLKSGEQYLDFALPWDTVKPVPYSLWSVSRTNISLLRSRSEKRTQSSKEFSEIRKEASDLLERQKKTLQPLTLEEARKEREELKTAKSKKDVKDPHKSHLSDEERRQEWLKEVKDDPYVRESMTVLTDMNTLPSRLSMN